MAGGARHEQRAPRARNGNFERFPQVVSQWSVRRTSLVARRTTDGEPTFQTDDLLRPNQSRLTPSDLTSLG